MVPISSSRHVRVLIVLLCGTRAAVAQTSPLTLQDAIAEARVHNASLPVAALDTAVAAAQASAAVGRLWPSVGLGGHLHGGTPSQYASGDARLQLAAAVPIYDGGRLRADVGRARADRMASTARFRVARRDVDLVVTLAFSQAIELEEEIAFGERGLGRLDRYLGLVRARRQSGQPVVSDLLKAQVERDREAADLAETRRRLAATMLQLKELLGRDPADTMELAPLPPPPAAAPAPPGPEPWIGAPDIAAADAARDAARTTIAAVRAERRPHIDLAANVGAEPVLGSSFEAPLNTGRDVGGELTLTVSWPLWDRGVHRSELAAARLVLDQSSQAAEVARREARLAWYQAHTDLMHLYEVVRLRDATVPTAEDAYLRAESLYRGGAASALDVLDAYTQWIQAGLEATRVRLDYRIAEARERRWGTP